MDCSQVKQKIPEWLDGELEDAEAGLITTHVKSCRGCQGEMAFWQKLGTVLQEDLGNIKAPPEFTAGVMAQLAGQQKAGFGRLISGWKHSLAVAATFLIVALGSVGAYMQMGGNIAGHVANGNDTKPGLMNKEPNPGNNTDISGILPVDPKNINDSDASGNQLAPGKQENEVGPNDAVQEFTGNRDDQSGTAQTGNTTPNQRYSSEQYALLSTEEDRVIERTLLKVKVEDINTAHKQALSFVNSYAAQYEVLGSESTPSGAQETLKIVVDNNLSGKLQDELKTLGQVVTTDTQKDDLNSRYNEKVEQYRSLQAQAQTTQTADEKNQLQVKMAGIEAQLKAWDREANTDTIILWLEN